MFLQREHAVALAVGHADELDDVAVGRHRPAALPLNWALPNVKTPPSAPASQYPCPPVRAMPTTGAFRRMPPVEPKNRALPNEKMPPSLATSQ